jgi:Ca-activated chloride channel family protein
VKTYDMTDGKIGKVYRGQQLVFFGRYQDAGRAELKLEATLTGEDKTYATQFDFPELDIDHPELERLWAMDRVEAIEFARDAGMLPATEAGDAVEALGVEYQIVTDETSMLVLSDEKFEERGIERRNRERLARERTAQSQRAGQPVVNRRVDGDNPAFNMPSPSVGGGAIDPFTAVALGLASATALGAAWNSRSRK